ncbi:hypothetical protein PT974_12268 [Cladobotryum mycophilum]|uniref:Uncharacterized protein n=1 Tax=Cladobotryum mycophilum TaxID=491253 RepID=A0ABR0S7I5_9HYPO
MKIEPYVKKVRSMIKSVLGEHDFAEDAETSALLALQLNESIPEILIFKPPKPSSVEDANSRYTFQFALPEVLLETPPPLEARSRRPAPTYNALVRPRAPSPRREAALVAQYSARACATAQSQLPRDPHSLYIPKFFAKVYSLRHKDISVPSNNLFPIDLVFKIIPWGEMPTIPGEIVPLLSSDADPPVPTMLSNMRFNVLKFYSNQKGSRRDPKEKRGTLNLQVVPRSSCGVVIDTFTEASFLISRAKISKWEGPGKKTATIHMTYHYSECGDPEDQKLKQDVLVNLEPL